MFRGQWHYNRNRHLVCYRVHGDSGLGCSDKHNCFCSLSNLFTHWNCSFTFWIEVFMNIGKTKECVKYLYWIILLAYISIYTQVLHNWICYSFIISSFLLVETELFPLSYPLSFKYYYTLIDCGLTPFWQYVSHSTAVN